MTVPIVFDRALLRARRDRATPTIADHDFLLRHTGQNLADRLDDIRRTFPLALDLGCHHAPLQEIVGPARGGITQWILMDLSDAMIKRARASSGQPGVIGDEEFLPFKPAVFDLVLNNLSLHATNDLPGALIQIRQILKPDGLFLGSLLGGQSLFELRAALAEAEIAEYGGISPRVAPFIDLRDAAGLLQRAGFGLPVADQEDITLTYPNFDRLMRDLRGMAGTNCLVTRRKQPLTRKFFQRAEQIYRDRYTDRQGRLQVSLQIVYLTGWAPHAGQQKALRPGSAQFRLGDFVGSQD